MDRRSFLKGAAIAASAPVVINEAPAAFDMNKFLATASPSELVHYHMGAAAEAMNLLRGSESHIVRMDTSVGMALVVPA